MRANGGYIGVLCASPEDRSLQPTAGKGRTRCCDPGAWLLSRPDHCCWWKAATTAERPSRWFRMSFALVLSRTTSGLSNSSRDVSNLVFVVGRCQQAALRAAHSPRAHKSSPPLEFAAEFDVVFASKRQFAVVANAE